MLFEPRQSARAVATVEMVLEADVHFCGVISQEGDTSNAEPEDAKPWQSCPTNLVPTASQLIVLLEESKALSEQRKEAVFTTEEFEAIARALTESGEDISSSVALALQLSRETADEEALQLALRQSEDSHRGGAPTLGHKHSCIELLLLHPAHHAQWP